MFLNAFQIFFYIFFLINVTYIQEGCINLIKYDREDIYNVQKTSISNKFCSF